MVKGSKSKEEMLGYFEAELVVTGAHQIEIEINRSTDESVQAVPSRRGFRPQEVLFAALMYLPITPTTIFFLSLAHGSTASLHS